MRPLHLQVRQMRNLLFGDSATVVRKTETRDVNGEISTTEQTKLSLNCATNPISLLINPQEDAQRSTDSRMFYFQSGMVKKPDTIIWRKEHFAVRSIRRWHNYDEIEASLLDPQPS